MPEKIWRAILSPSAPSVSQPLEQEALGSSSPSGSELTFAVGEFLDSEQRYCVLESATAPSAAPDYDVELKVADNCPSAPPFLESRYNVTTIAAFSSPASDLPEPEPAQAESDLPPLTANAAVVERVDNEAAASASNGNGTQVPPVPSIVPLYLDLQDRLYPAMPQMHDAWEQDGQTIVVLEDRTGLPTILDCLRDETVLPFQVITWFYDTTKLWAALESCQCCSSVLRVSNLRIDEDQIICLQRLYFDVPDHLPTLKALGVLWHSLFQQAQRTYLGSIAQLCYELEIGEISTLEDLQQRLRTIADEFQNQPSSIELPTIADFCPPTLPPEVGDLDMSADQTQPLIVMPENLDFMTDPDQTRPPLVSDESASDNGTLDPSLSVTSPISRATQSDGDPSTDGDDLPTIVLPMQLLSLEDSGRTDIGRQRKHNEDYFIVKTDVQKNESPVGRNLKVKGLYILCDGMGGHAGGEVASVMAAQTLEKYFEDHWGDQLPDEQTIMEAVHLANNAIYDLNQQSFRSGSGRMGTTLVMVLVQGTQVAIAHVGDSRLYRCSRRQGLESLTIDHEVGQREIQRGVDPVIAYSRSDAYQLTQALGPRDQDFVHPDVMFLDVNEDSLLLLCSDGMTDDDLLEAYWQTHIEPLLSPQSSLDQGAMRLVDLANQHNGHDNITVILVRMRVRPTTKSLGQP